MCIFYTEEFSCGFGFAFHEPFGRAIAQCNQTCRKGWKGLEMSRALLHGYWSAALHRAEIVFWERHDDAYYREPQALDIAVV